MKVKAYKHDDEYYYSLVRKNVRRQRLAQNLTQQDVADMIEVSRGYITDMENEKRNKHFNIAILGRIADALGIPIAEFFKE